MSVTLTNELRRSKMPTLYATIGGVKKELNRGYVRAVYCNLCEHAQPDGSRVFPSVLTMEWETDIHERYIRYIIKALVENGFIFLVGHTYGGVNRYVINKTALENLEKKPAKLLFDDDSVEQEVLEMLGQNTVKEQKSEYLVHQLWGGRSNT